MPKRPGRKRGILYDKFGQEIIEEPEALEEEEAEEEEEDAEAES